jgi:hypothetical protein
MQGRSTAAAGTNEVAKTSVHPRDAGVPDAPAPIQAAHAETAATGKLKVVILPWVEVWVDGKPLGKRR